MLTNEADAMRIAAVLAAAQYSAHMHAAQIGNAPNFTDSAVDVLINVLREMEQKRLISPGIVPTPRR